MVVCTGNFTHTTHLVCEREIGGGGGGGGLEDLAVGFEI